MDMKAITDHFGVEDAPRLALEAGCDLLIYRTEATARQAYEALTRALEKNTLSPETVLEAEARVQKLKKEFMPSYQPVTIAELGQKIATPEHLDFVRRLEEKSKPL
jgi:beta-N-acetylhexosaminidase